MPLHYNDATTAPSSTSSASGSAAPSVTQPASAPAPVRSLADLRTKLAGNGGVNPPESKVPETALAPRTTETPDGGAAPLAPLPDTPTTKRTRRTPAQMAAARAASAAPSTTTTSQPATVAGAGSPPATDAAALGGYTLAALLA